MYCSNCGTEFLEQAIFCSNCGKELSTSGVSSVGDGNVNIGGNSNFTNSKVHLGDVYQNKQEETAFIDRTYVKPLTFANRPIRVSWMITSGLIGFLGSLASIYSVLGSNVVFLFMLLFLLSVSLLGIGGMLKKTRFAYLRWFNLEANKVGDVFLTKIGGKCPNCDGNLKLVNLEIFPENYKVCVRCDRISDHIWKFDPSVLD